MALPTGSSDGATKGFVEKTVADAIAVQTAAAGRFPVSMKPYLSLYTKLGLASNIEGYHWDDMQSIMPGLTEEQFDTLPAGLNGCFTEYLPVSRTTNLPQGSK